jgi:peptidoglycan/xylan/chitin deacetylase (PgdA/CDA1 family)
MRFNIFGSNQVKRLAVSIVVAATGFSGIMPALAHAAVTSPTPTAKVSFTFDDGQQSAYTQAAPILAKYGLSGTGYIITGCVGMTTTPNTCRANTDLPYMTWAQIQSLQNTYGWEIGSHTVDHDCLASSSIQDPSDCQKTALTTAQLDAELANSKSALAANGITATDFAPPYGDFSNSVLAEIAKYYATMRQFKNAANNPNVWPYSDYYLQNIAVQEKTDTVASLEAKINTAITNNQWLVLTFHDITSKPSQVADDYEYGTGELDQLAAYVQTKVKANQIQSVHINQGLVTSDTNLLSDPSFIDGIADGWTTDNATAITADNANNGSYPSPTNSIKLVSPNSGTAHLFSPKVSVDPNTTYMFKNFLNVRAVTSGTIGFYVDEYNANGSWISGKYLAQETSAFVEDMNFMYKPSSSAVSTASLQVIDSGTGLTAYLDNSQMFALSTATPPPAQTNLIANGTFDAGISGGWTTDSASTIKADSANNGSPANPVNSVSLTSSTSNTHLFSPTVAVSSTHTYNLSAYLNVKTINTTAGSEIGFYVDEYDSSGNWVSGQYKTGIRTVGASTVSFTYTPSSTTVAKASLQVIVVANSGIQAYFDNVIWVQN